MDATDHITELQVELRKVDNKLDDIGNSIEESFRDLERKRKIDYGRPRDFGRRHFTIQVVLDNFNAEDFERKSREITKLLYAWRSLREEQQKIIREIGTEESYVSVLGSAAVHDIGVGGLDL